MPPPALDESGKARYVINEIPQSRWPDGIPAVMGAHLMASGTVAPISTSKGPGDGNVPHVFQYHKEETDTNVVQYTDFDTAARGLVSQTVTAANAAIAERGAFAVAISGGSMLKALPLFAGARTDFTKWWVFFVDERVVPHSSPDSTYGAAKAGFLEGCGIPEAQVLEIHEGLTAAEAARNYEGRMLDVPASALPRNAEGLPVLDCLLLGTGPDGHIASLFPNSAQLSSKEGWILPVVDSPKPPPERITMTLPVINAAKQSFFLACGSGKAEVLHRILECQALPGAVPAQLVRPAGGPVTWLVDLEASSQLAIADWDDKKKFPRSQM